MPRNQKQGPVLLDWFNISYRNLFVAIIGLVAVAPQARGLSLGPQLVDASLRWFAAHGCERVAVTTQGRNARALRLYESAGFRNRSLDLWYHWWPGTDSGGALR